MTDNTQSISRLSLLKWLITEEWRTHAELFGGKRFVGFPLVVFAFATVLGLTIPLISVDIQTTAFLLHGFVILFGIQTGIIGFDAQDALENVIGDMTSILFSSRVLPISQDRLASYFLLKDGLYYSAIVLVPLFVGGIIGISSTPFSSRPLLSSVTALDIALTYGTMSIAFLFGATTGFAIASLQLKSNLRTIFGGATLLTLGYVAQTAVDFSITNLTSMNRASLTGILVGGSLVAFAVGILRFDGSDRRTYERHRQVYRPIKSLVIRPLRLRLSSGFGPELYRPTSSRPEDNTSPWDIAIKTIIDISRSSGGLWKIAFISGTTALSGFAIVAAVGSLYPLAPVNGVLFGSLTSLIAYPVYSIVFRYDDFASYLKLPVTNTDVWTGKVRVFYLLTLPLAVSYYLPAMLLLTSEQLTFPAIEQITIGAVVMVGLILYQLGLLVTLVRDEPTKFLFDGLVFSIYSVGVFAAIVPALVVGMFGLLLPGSVTAGLAAYAIVAGLFGMFLVRRN